MKKQMISWRQAFVLIFISYMLVALTYIPTAEANAKNVDKLASIFVAMGLVLLSFLPVCFLSRRNEGCNVIDCVQQYARPFTKPIALFYVVAFSYTIILTISRFSLFITSVLLVETRTAVFIIIILAAACYAAFLGIEAIARASLFVFAVLVFSMLFSSFILVKEFDFLNLRPFFYNGFTDIFTEAVLDASKLIEVAVLLCVSSECMKYVVRGRRHSACMVLTVVVIFAFSMFASVSFERYLAISSYIISGVVTVTASVVIPLVLLVVDIIKKRRHRNCVNQVA
ncbi:MAG: GerAB/ArcD/ProY family transporter [Clostridia bacterium]|nr:GerAB/ArcD/ProY family transporter [Clostridia bacterium]